MSNKAIIRPSHVRGINHPRSRLSEADIIRIRELHASGMNYTDIADEFGTSLSTISNICTGYTYANIGGPISNIRHRRENEHKRSEQ